MVHPVSLTPTLYPRRVHRPLTDSDIRKIFLKMIAKATNGESFSMLLYAIPVPADDFLLRSEQWFLSIHPGASGPLYTTAATSRTHAPSVTDIIIANYGEFPIPLPLFMSITGVTPSLGP